MSRTTEEIRAAEEKILRDLQGTGNRARSILDELHASLLEDLVRAKLEEVEHG